MFTPIHTTTAPEAIGVYSQAVRTGQTVYLSGQIALNPQTMEMAEGIDAQIRQVFKNLQAVCEAAGGGFAQLVKLNIYLTDLSNFSKVNEFMSEHFAKPYPARAVVGAAALPRAALIEVDGILGL